jgi:hypothetical protein
LPFGGPVPRPIPYLKIYDASIVNYLKYEVLPVHFTEKIVNEPLVYDADLGGYSVVNLMSPSPTSLGRGWAIFDEVDVGDRVIVDTTAEQTSQITVTGATTYEIDYLNGVIKNPDTTPTAVTYNWYYVSLVEGWPSTDPPPNPVVAVDIDKTIKAGFQLGGGTKDTIQGSVYVFASSESEKKDITDALYQSMYNRTVPIGNWHEGTYLDFDGTYTGFQPTTVSGLSSGAFVNVEAELNGPRMDWSEVNRHRSRIRFTFEVYKN